MISLDVMIQRCRNYLRNLYKELPGSIRNMSSWDNLQRLSSGRLFASTFIFLFAIPAVAHFSTQLPDPLEIPYSNGMLGLKIVLPFRWILLYWAAFFAALANLVYFARCPAIVRKHKNFIEFQSQGLGPGDLVEYLRQIVPMELRSQIVTYEDGETNTARGVAVEYICRKLLKWSPQDIRHDGISTGIYQGTGQVRQVLEKLPTAFAYIRKAAGYSRPFARSSMLFFLLMAIGCFSIVLFQNIIWVSDYLQLKGV